MICIRSAYIPENRKTKSNIQWRAYIEAMLKELRGLDKHKK